MSDMAIKYAMKKKKMAHGGDVKGVHKQAGIRQGTSEAGIRNAQANFKSGMAEKFNNPAYHVLADEHRDAAKEKHREVLGEMKSMAGQDRKYLAEGGAVCHTCQGSGYAEGGMVHEEEESGYEHMPEENEDDDMINHIMMKRMSKGGMVANDSEDIADFEDNQFDDLVKDDHLDEHYTGKDSGDEDGDEAEDEDRKDVVSQIMKSRKKKDKMPRPA